VSEALRRTAPLPRTIVGVLLWVLVGCTPSKREAEPSQAAPLELSTDEQRFLLIEHIPFGLTYKEVKERLPSLREIHPDGHSPEQGEEGLFEASAPTTAFGREASLEFNFGKKGLYSYYFWLTDLTAADAATYQTALRAFYSKRYGRPHRQPGEQVDADYWFQPGYRVVLRRFAFGTGVVLQWGYEERSA